MVARTYIAGLTQLVYCCLAASPASSAQDLARATPSLLKFVYNDTLPLPTLASMMPVSFPSSYIITGSDPQVILQIRSFSHDNRLPIVSFTRAVLQGMDEIVRQMRIYGGDGPVPLMGYILRADDIVIDIFSVDGRGSRFTYSVAETLLRGTWELFAQYGFYAVYMKIFLGSLDAGNHIGEIVVHRGVGNGTVTTTVPATDT